MADEIVLVLFARAPETGKVKSRLAPALGEAGARRVYERLLARQIDLLNTLVAGTGNLGLQVHIAGDPAHTAFKPFNGERLTQSGTTLGERMYHALKRALLTSGRAVLVGCDCPQMSVPYLRQAMVSLSDKHPVVLGPALDGGYVLVGCTAPVPAIFDDIDWGSDQVMAQTRARLRALGLAWRELPALRDVDRPEDIALLNELGLET